MQNNTLPFALRLLWSGLSLCLAAVLTTAVWVSEASANTSTRHDPKPAAAHKRIDHSGKPQTGVASFYGKRSSRQKTASGAPMSPNSLTAASRTLPLGTKAEVINKDNGRSTDVTITDRGPYVKSRILDVSPKAANQLGMTSDGVSEVKVVPVQEPPAPKADTAPH